MYSKSLLIAVAALALTATSAQAFSSEALARANLTQQQREAFSIARELQKEGEIEKAKEVLVEAGIDDLVLERLRTAMSAAHHEVRETVEAAIEADDFNAFLAAIADTPLSDIITTEEDFGRFKEAFDLRAAGEVEEAKAILKELGVPSHHGRLHHTHKHLQERLDLSDSEAEALKVARAANDHETVRAILTEAGVTWRGAIEHRLKDGRRVHEDE